MLHTGAVHTVLIASLSHAFRHHGGRPGNVTIANSKHVGEVAATQLSLHKANVCVKCTDLCAYERRTLWSDVMEDVDLGGHYTNSVSPARELTKN